MIPRQSKMQAIEMRVYFAFLTYHTTNLDQVQVFGYLPIESSSCLVIQEALSLFADRIRYYPLQLFQYDKIFINMKY